MRNDKEDGEPMHSWKGIKMPEPPEGYAWTYLCGEPRLANNTTDPMKSVHKGWVTEYPHRPDGPEYVIVVLRDGGDTKLVDNIKEPKEAVFMLHTLICLGEPT